jgi:acetyltransferase-like isoleucine patch superfamily enzyme
MIYNFRFHFKNKLKTLFMFPLNLLLFFIDIPKSINYKVKYSIYPRLFQVTKKSNVVIGPLCEFLHAKNIQVGNYSTILHKSYLWAGFESKISIGNNVMIGSNVMIVAFDHKAEISYTPFQKQGYLEGDIIIKDNVWIGYGATILKNVNIGNNCVVGAGSVVHSSIPDNCVVLGNPAKIIKKL